MSNDNLKLIPKRFIIFDKLTQSFCGEETDDKPLVFDENELAEFYYMHHSIDSFPQDRFVLYQSIERHDRKDNEVFEGAIVKDFDDEVGVVYYERTDAQFLIRFTNGDIEEGGRVEEGMEILGHVAKDNIDEVIAKVNKELEEKVWRRVTNGG